MSENDRTYFTFYSTPQREKYWQEIEDHVREQASPYLGVEVKKTTVFDFMLAFVHKHIKDNSRKE